MKSVRILAVAVLGYAAALVPTVSQASSVVVSLPGLHVRLPAPPILPVILPPGVSVHEDHVVGYEPVYRPLPAPRYYREGWRDDWRYDRWDRHYDRDRYDHRNDHDRDGDHHDHDRGDWHR
ncbi:MAG TPA: hypothetical protein VFW00_05485 [Rhodocyclaceae bacterium]|nr:hypothetical protein [Rhodocyclaceae bacterium]